MTPVQTRANGLVIPPLPQLLLTAALRMLAELVLHVASTLRMRFRRGTVIGTQPMPQALPEETTDKQETKDRRAPARQTRSVNTDAAANHHDDDRTIMIIVSRSGPLVRLPGEGRGPAITSHLVPPCSFKAEQASTPALDPGLRRGCGRASVSTNKNAAA